MRRNGSPYQLLVGMENGAAGAGAQRNIDAATPPPGTGPRDQKAGPGRDVAPARGTVQHGQKVEAT